MQLQGQTNRDICLIPVSAHGTNPASAVMVGMKVLPSPPNLFFSFVRSFVLITSYRLYQYLATRMEIYFFLIYNKRQRSTRTSTHLFYVF
jgi:hypothetical protein